MALACNGVEELVVIAGHLHAVSAATAVLIEGLRDCAVIRRLCALASAVLWLPLEVDWASLVKASALTLNGVEVLTIEEASLWGAFEIAGVGVEDIRRMFFPAADVESRFALA